MRKLIIIFITTLFAGLCYGQTRELTEGRISYITSQSVYIKFANTNGLKAGDTLMINTSGTLKPAILIRSTSSTSCVGEWIGNSRLKVNDMVVTNKITDKQLNPPPELKKETVKSAIISDTLKNTAKEPRKLQKKGELHGRLSVSSYSDLSDKTSNTQRMRYGLMMNAANIGGSALSAESYINFSHISNQWDQIQTNVFNGLKIYNLAVKYDINASTRIWAGRKINNHIANMGAVDGIQIERQFKSFTTGFLLGSRPDDRDYSFNTSLLQTGIFVSHDFSLKNKMMQNTLAFVEQRNSGKTDRRFVYFQHNSSLIRAINFFGSAEIDLYKKVNDVQKNKPEFTNYYLSLYYRPTKPFGVSVSYSERSNIIYYETYKNIVQQLLEAEATRSFTASAWVRTFKRFTFGANAGYRVQKSDHLPANNLYGYLTYNPLKAANFSATLSATTTSSGYMSGNIYSAGVSRDFFRNKINLGLVYRNVDFKYEFSNTHAMQHVGELNLTFYLFKKLSLTTYYEGTYETDNMHHRIYLQLSQRF